MRGFAKARMRASALYLPLRRKYAPVPCTTLLSQAGSVSGGAILEDVNRRRCPVASNVTVLPITRSRRYQGF